MVYLGKGRDFFGETMEARTRRIVSKNEVVLVVDWRLFDIHESSFEIVI